MKFYSGLVQSKQSSARRPKLHGSVVNLEFGLFILSGVCLFFYSILYIYVAAEKTTANSLPPTFFFSLSFGTQIYILKSQIQIENTNIKYQIKYLFLEVKFK